MLLSAKKEKTSQGKEVFFFLRWITEVFLLSKPLYQCGILISADNNDLLFQKMKVDNCAREKLLPQKKIY